jgi:uncharacterized protein
MDQIFDPFNDRTARDIRNSLSSALVAELAQDRPGAVVEVARQWERRDLLPVYRNYIRQARERYLEVRSAIRLRGVRDLRRQAVVLWNAGLFFELHELLEVIWHAAVGMERTALKGFIQAAGVYVHSQRGKPAAATALARRARQNLEAGRPQLDFIANLDQLLKHLEHPLRLPPELVLSLA